MKMNRLYAFLTGAAALVLSCCGSGSSGETALTLDISPTSHMQVFSTDTYNSYLYLPQEYGADSGVTWPVIVYLHGYSEAGLAKAVCGADRKRENLSVHHSHAAKRRQLEELRIDRSDA